MLEGLVAWVLNNYLGKYVENLNTDQLSVALLSGKVELENLPLKKDALRHLGLPVEVKSGFIGKVQLQVPVRQIRSAPWLIVIEKLYLVAAPVNLDEWDGEVEAHIAHERKVALLDALEAQWRAEHEGSDAGYYAASYSTWLSYGTGLLANIVENLQLKVTDVHIRYEDALTCEWSSFACGLTMESLSAESCDREWCRGFTLLTNDHDCSFKLLELEKLAVYWDPMPVPSEMFANCSISELAERMGSSWKRSHRYIAHPTDARARVRRERTEQPLRARTRPRVACHLTLDNVQLDVTARQYSEAVCCSVGLERIGKLREFRALRPAVAVKGNARLWWIYAVKCHMPDESFSAARATWSSCLSASRRAVQYVRTSTASLANPAATLPADVKQAKDDYEWNTPLPLLRALREVAMRKVPKASPTSTPDTPASSGRSMLVHWFPQWWGWYSPAPAPSPGAPPDLEGEILDVLADSIDNNTLLKRDTVFGKFDFTLNKGCLNLSMDGEEVGRPEENGLTASSEQSVGLELQFSSVAATFEWRVRAGALCARAALGAVTLTDRSTKTMLPVLVAPQGVIREQLSALGGAPTSAGWGRAAPSLPAHQPPLLQITYEKKPVGLSADYKLWVKSESLEIVYSQPAVTWMQRFLAAGGRPPAPSPLQTTRNTLMHHWDHIVHGHIGVRRSWQVELDISAPQILFVEDPCERDTAVMELDFGRLRLVNGNEPYEPSEEHEPPEINSPTDDDDDELFMTPCSTPPGSLASPPPSDPPLHLDPHVLRTTLYDTYKIELSDLQILVGRARDNWKYAHTKSTSSLHLLDRFNISLQAERVVVQSRDPLLPTATLCGTLPSLVVHLSEQKLSAVKALLAPTEHSPTSVGVPPAPRQPAAEPHDDDVTDSETEHSAQYNVTQFMVHFAIDQMSLEVQSRGRAVAEVQVRGVRVAGALRARDVSGSLSVHSLLLVDALQTYGADYELLIASHKHVGMDTASGSILGSEPTSPTSPRSPDARSPPPHALQDAIYSLHHANIKSNTWEEHPRTSPGPSWAAGGGHTWGNHPTWGYASNPWGNTGGGSVGGGWTAAAGLVDSEALIAIELCIVKGDDNTEDLRIANILFNNLDIIANQETIVELIGFTQRVLGSSKPKKVPSMAKLSELASVPSTQAVNDEQPKKQVRTEITFDFHRLGVLLLRAAVEDGGVVANKVATATISEAKIQATLDSSSVLVSGSLGGVQMVSLCSGTGPHSRVVWAGQTPSAPEPHSDSGDDDKALTFNVTRKLMPQEDGELPVVEVVVEVHVASVWYSHCGLVLQQLRLCLCQFQQYLADLARGLRAAADRAITLVQHRGESLYVNPKLSGSMEGVSPRRRTTSLGGSLDEHNEPSPTVLVSVQLEVESPVVVVPRRRCSPQVLVAHLGRISVSNHNTSCQLQVTHISLASVDVGDKLSKLQATNENMSSIYDVKSGKPILHNTALHLCVDYDATKPKCEVSGAVVDGLHVSSSREQYEQLLDTIKYISEDGARVDDNNSSSCTAQSTQSVDGVETLKLNPALLPPPQPRPLPGTFTLLAVKFELPTFTVELVGDLGEGERSLVQLAFREFSVCYDRSHMYETTLQVSLHSVEMEDLSAETSLRHRVLMVSHPAAPPPPRRPRRLAAASCPDLRLPQPRGRRASLPDNTQVQIVPNKRDSRCGITPPCSPAYDIGGKGTAGDNDAEEEDLVRGGDDNLVWVSVHTRDPNHPQFQEKYNKVSKLTKMDFNCLNLVVSIDSWVAVLDFFGVAGEDTPDDDDQNEPPTTTSPVSQDPEVSSSLEVSVRSLSAVLVARGSDVCRALVSRVRVHSRAWGSARTLSGRLGALRVADAAARPALWRDRFRTHGDHALTFQYQRLSTSEASKLGYETSLSISMGAVTYVHTKRFVQQLQSFATEFSLLRRVIIQARKKVSVSVGTSKTQRQRLSLRCATPVIIVPVSCRSRAALVAQLDQLSLDNTFKYVSEDGTVHDADGEGRVLVDVRTAVLEGLALWCGEGKDGLGAGGGAGAGAPLLSAPAHLTITMQYNLTNKHTVPDMSVWCSLSTLAASLTAAQYRVLRGVLAHNLAGAPPQQPMQHMQQAQHQPVWTTMSLKLDLQDVTVVLEPERGVSSLACINFIRCSLLVETYSDLSQDIDLLSQEILVSDTRYAREPANRRDNVFSHIVQPMPDHRHSVQAEVHARKRPDSSAYTILINNMRLMAILDWWEAAQQLILQPPPPAADPDLVDDTATHPLHAPPGTAWSLGGEAETDTEAQMELKLNITDSQLVLVEDASVWDTNAVILKSTTVITYRPCDVSRSVLCEVSELEVFSCVLGLEEETALSILDPAALHVALHRDRRLHVVMGTLNLRLSYHDMRMFAAMLHSLPVQVRNALSGKKSEEEEPANSVHLRGRSAPPAPPAAPRAPRWPPHDRVPLQQQKPKTATPLRAVQVSADCVTLCVIDDCLDSDVPLLEVCLGELKVEQDLRKAEESFEDPKLVITPSGPPPPGSGRGSIVSAGGRRIGAGGGTLSGYLTADYYNRTLSGWEPIIEPWRFKTLWEYTLTSGLSLGRLQVDVTSQEVLNTNVTSTFIELTQLVKSNWAADYYAPQTTSTSEQSPKGSPSGHRRRSPFVPYALRNHTGHKLWFTTILTTSDAMEDRRSWSGPDDSWVVVRAGQTEPFSFGRRTRVSPRTPPLHRLALRLDGWAPPDPVTVDRTAVVFRNITHVKTGAQARLVFEITLEGSARKLVTVRSALQLHNKLPHPVEVKVDHAPSTERLCVTWRALQLSRAPSAPPPGGADTLHPLHPLPHCGQWSSSASRTVQVAPGGVWAAPLSAAPGALWTRVAWGTPLPAAPTPLDWRSPPAPATTHHECRAPPSHVYRFCCAIRRERFPVERGSGSGLAGHTLTLVPALRLDNLLPLALHVRAAPAAGDAVLLAAGTVAPGATRPFHEVNIEEGVELSVKLDNFGWSSALSVGGGGAGSGGAGGGGAFTARLKLRDTRGRRLYLTAKVSVDSADGVKVSISAAYWLVNRTGLPLVFRAEGGAAEAAGQGEGVVRGGGPPLLFSFADTDATPTIAVRLADSTQWCSPFGLGPGTAVKRLESGERCYHIGVSSRCGRGRYRRTNILTFTPRYQIHNNSSLHLQFAQKCTATTLNDPGALATYMWCAPGQAAPWHWARADRPPLLCVRPLDASPPHAPAAAWAGALTLTPPRATHVACRQSGGTYTLVRVEVVVAGASVLLVLSDASAAPPPLRIDNYSAVAIMFHQVGCTEESVVGAHSSLSWAPPEPEGTAAISLRAPGGPRTTISLEAIGTVHHLAYQNFIYIVFTATQNRDSLGAMSGGAGSESGALVLEVPLGSTRVVLARKRYGDRCQLWRRGPNEQLVHEGSSPPQPTDALLTEETTLTPHSMVLDIEGPAPRPGRAAALVLRRADPRRASTQAWRLLACGRMACAHNNLAVQPDNGLMGLTPGSRAVLCLAEGRRGGIGSIGGGGGGTAPAEQKVSWQTLRPGSGRLDVALHTNGPTPTLQIHSHNDKESGWIEGLEEEATCGHTGREWGLQVTLGGLAVSLVGRDPPEELVYALFADLRLSLSHSHRPPTHRMVLTVVNMQWDNQLLGTSSPVLLQALPERGGGLPALHAAAELVQAPPSTPHHYYCSHLALQLSPLAVRLEERLMLKLWWWAAPEVEDAGVGDVSGGEAEEELATCAAIQHHNRYYFAVIKIIPSQVRLSMCTSNKLEGELQRVKRRLGLTLVKFEDAAVELEPFVRTHHYETPKQLTMQLLKHFKDELKWQAAKILGSVDFLGNPLGFVADVSEGVTGFIREGNVSALLKNVTHGISNSAAKVTESLGDGLERVVSDEAHEETRRRIRSAAPGHHLVAGLRGLGLGILGGMTSLVKHSYEGAAAEGLGGLVAGVGKGLIGTVTKPVIGVLDFAAETAAALRDTSKTSDKWVPARVRLPRAAGGGRLLARYCPTAATGAALLHALQAGSGGSAGGGLAGGAAGGERLLAYRAVRAAPHDIRALLSSTHLRILTCKHATPHVVMETHLSNLVSCTAVTSDGAHYVELGVRGGGAGGGGSGGAGGGGGEGLRRPRVQCDSAELAEWVARHAAYATQLYYEQLHTLQPYDDDK